MIAEGPPRARRAQTDSTGSIAVRRVAHSSRGGSRTGSITTAAGRNEIAISTKTIGSPAASPTAWMIAPYAAVQSVAAVVRRWST